MPSLTYRYIMTFEGKSDIPRKSLVKTDVKVLSKD